MRTAGAGQTGLWAAARPPGGRPSNTENNAAKPSFIPRNLRKIMLKTTKLYAVLAMTSIAYGYQLI